MPDLPPEPVKAANVLAESNVLTKVSAHSAMTALRIRAGGGGFYVDEDEVLYRVDRDSGPHEPDGAHALLVRPVDAPRADDSALQFPPHPARPVPAEEPAP